MSRQMKQQFVVSTDEKPLEQGDRANKVGGSFQASGVIVSAFKTTEGEQRFVFEFDVPKGMLHIYGPSQLRKAQS